PKRNDSSMPIGRAEDSVWKCEAFTEDKIWGRRITTERLLSLLKVRSKFRRTFSLRYVDGKPHTAENVSDQPNAAI
ncbi:MAG: hypothetical protein ACK52N_03235, partial [Lysobacteraceae bacterium]